MHKVYIEFSISGIIVVDETEKERVMLEMSKLMSKFIRNKDIIEFQNSIESSDQLAAVEDMMEDMMVEVGEA